MIEIFERVKKQYQKHGDKYFIDKSVLTEGIYVRINQDLSITTDDILFVKSKKTEEYPFELYNWFRERDFYSKIIYDSANKCIDTNEKKIHSINPFSIIMKRKSLPDVVDQLSKSTLKLIDSTGFSNEQIFDTFFNIHFEKMKELYSTEIDYSHYEYILRQKTKGVVHLLSEETIKDDTRIKIFLDVDILEYKKFFIEYMREKSFCDNKFNKEIEGKVFGALGYNNTLNADKPTLLMRTTSFKAPYRTSIEDSILFYKMSLIIKDIIKELKENPTGTILEVNGKGEVENYEIINPNESSFSYKEYRILQPKNQEDIFEDGMDNQKNRKDIEKELNHEFLKGLLYSLYKINTSSDVSDFQKSANKKFTDVKIFNQLVMSRHALKSYFEKGYDIDIFQTISKLTRLIFDYELANASFNEKDRFYNQMKLRKLWDIEICLLHYFSEGRRFKHMATTIKEIYLNTKKELTEQEFFEIKDDETFYFLAGQVGAYLVSQTEAKDKNGRMFVPFLQAKNSTKIKDLLTLNYENYAHNLPMYSQASINKAIQSINGYSPNKEFKKNDLEYIYRAGIIGANLFYTKKEKIEENKEEQE